MLCGQCVDGEGGGLKGKDFTKKPKPRAVLSPIRIDSISPLRKCRLNGISLIESLLLSAFMQGYRYTYMTAGILCLGGVIAIIMRASVEKETKITN